MSAVATINNARTIEEWAEDIGTDLNEGAECLARAGRKLIESKEQLGHGNFLKLVARLRLCASTAQRLMAISRRPMLSNTANTPHLPTTFSALQELLRLGDDNLADAIDKGLVTPDLKVKAARAIAGAYNTPEGEIVGGAKHMLPSPTEARKIAEGTNRIVAASDGNLYTGASDKEVGEYITRRRHVFGVREAIERIADCDISAQEWVEGSERHWLSDFRPGAIDDAIDWLTAAKEALGVVDA